MKCSLGITNFLEEVSSLSQCTVFPYSLYCSLRKTFLSLLAILWNSAFRWIYLSFSSLPFISLLFSASGKASSDNQFDFLHFFFLGMVLITTCHTVLWTSVCRSSGTLSIRSNFLNLFIYLYNHKGFDPPQGSNGFPYFLQFKSEFYNMEFIIWTTGSSQSCFCWLYRPSPSSSARI